MIRDFYDDIDGLFGEPRHEGPPTHKTNAVDVTALKTTTLPPGDGMPLLHQVPCEKCRGSGNFVGWSGRIVGRCRACQGKGKVARKTSPEQLKRNRERAATKRAALPADNWEAFAAVQPEVAAWIETTSARFDFARSMGEAVRKYGHLTPARSTWCRRRGKRTATTGR